MSQLFDKPKFLNIVQYFLNTNCDMEQQLASANNTSF